MAGEYLGPSQTPQRAGEPRAHRVRVRTRNAAVVLPGRKLSSAGGALSDARTPGLFAAGGLGAAAACPANGTAACGVPESRRPRGPCRPTPAAPARGTEPSSQGAPLPSDANERPRREAGGGAGAARDLGFPALRAPPAPDPAAKGEGRPRFLDAEVLAAPGDAAPGILATQSCPPIAARPHSRPRPRPAIPTLAGGCRGNERPPQAPQSKAAGPARQPTASHPSPPPAHHGARQAGRRQCPAQQRRLQQAAQTAETHRGSGTAKQRSSPRQACQWTGAGAPHLPSLGHAH